MEPVLVGWMPVTRDAAAIPFGPFAPLVPELGPTLLSESGATAAYGIISARLGDGDLPPLLVVDDAHLLDRSSAATVHALARNEALPVVATIRSGERVPDAITALWKDVGLARMELGPLSREEADTLCSALLDGDADVRTRAEFFKRSRGHPLELREVVLAARESGALSRMRRGGWLSSTPTRSAPAHPTAVS